VVVAKKLPVHIFMKDDFNIPSKHLLVAGTEEILQLVLSTALEEAGYKVSTAKDGVEALFMIETFNFTQRPFDLIVLDVQLSQLSWPELTEKLDKLNILTPLIIIGSPERKGQQKKYYSDRLIRFLEPPFTKEEFLGMINHVLAL